MRVLSLVCFSTVLSLLLSLLLLGACSDSDEAPDWMAEEPPPSRNNRWAEEVPSEPVSFTVHEWGLLGHHYDASTDTEVLLATGRGRGLRPPPPPRPPTPPGRGKRVHGEEGKPVIYFHLDEPGGDTPIRVTLDVGEGQMMEQLPAARREGSHYYWDVVATRGSCRATANYPEADDGACSGREDGYCEAAELAAYESGDGACLRVDGDRWNHLFYRTRVRATLPVHVRRDSDGFHLRTTQALPGKLMRIQRGVRLADTRVHIFDAPGEGVELTLPDASAQGAAEALQEIRSELRDLGMTLSESAAFLRAWSADLVGSNTALRNGVQDVRAPSDLEPKADVLLYFLPESIVQEMAPLLFEPAARAVRRAILVRIDLGAPVEAQEPSRKPDQEAHLSWMNPRVGGALDRNDVRRQQRMHEAEFVACYEQAVEDDPRATGLAELHYDIAPDGTTAGVGVRWRAGGSIALSECLETAIRAWTFERPVGAVARVRQPLLFEQR